MPGLPLLPLLIAAAFLAGLCPAGADPVHPQLSGHSYFFAFPADGPRFEVEPSLGARISSLKLGNREFLYVDWNRPP